MGKKVWFPFIPLLTAVMILGLNGCTQINESENAIPDTSFRVEDEAIDIQQEETTNLQSNTEAADTSIYEVKRQELYVERDGNQIYGVLYLPQGITEKMPAVIFSHGYGGSYQGVSRYAQAVAERGYVAYCFDFCGGSAGSRSDGSTLDMTLFTEQDDLETVISEIRNQSYIDRDNLFLIGASQGGVVSAVTAASHINDVRGMVLIYPALVMTDDAKEMFQSADQIPESYSFMGMTVGRSYFEVLMDYDIYDAIAPYERDVLIIHGDADTIAPISYSEHAIEVYPSAELKVVPGARHGFDSEGAQQAIEWVLEYLQNHRV